MDDSQNKIIIKELQHITKLLVFLLTKEMKQVNKIDALSKAGFQPKEIADLLGTTGNTVNVTLSKKRNKGTNNDE